MFKFKNISGSRALYRSNDNVLFSWQDSIFAVVCFLLILTISISFLFNVYQAVLHEKWPLMAVYTILYALIAILVVYKKIPFRISLWSGVLIFCFSGLLPHVSNHPWYEDISIFWAVNTILIIVLALLANELKSLICCRKETVISTEKPDDRTEKKNPSKKPAQTCRFKEIGYLSRDVAHDLNSLLSGIATYPEVLLMDNDLDKTTREGLMIIKDAGQKAADIVSDFLTVSTGITAEKKSTDLNYLLDEFFKTPEFKMLKTTFPEISITAQQEPELLCINASYAHMEKTVNHLLRFACSHLDRSGQGQVIVATSNKYFHKKAAKEKSILPGEYISLQIHIIGNGLENEHSDHLFEPFYTRKVMKKEGTGLEMVIVWHTIQDHEGMIHWTAGPADICFDLYFPAFRLPIDHDTLSIDEIKGNQEKILVIDSYPVQGKIACDILKALGYNAWPGDYGPETHMNIKQENMDVIILDRNIFDDEDGIETLRVIKSVKGRRKVILTHSGDAGSKRESKMIRMMGIKTFVKKPYTFLDLGIVIKEELEK